jgi:hypothetical protein
MNFFFTGEPIEHPVAVLVVTPTTYSKKWRYPVTTHRYFVQGEKARELLRITYAESLLRHLQAPLDWHDNHAILRPSDSEKISRKT